MTEIILQKNILPGGMAKFDLIGKNLPQDFLGLATDVDFQNKFPESAYQEMILSPELQKLADQNQMINMAKAIPEEGKVVLGLTLKANHLVALPDGLLVSLIFKDQALEATGFSNQVLSIYQNGRQNVQGEWLINNETMVESVKNTEIPAEKLTEAGNETAAVLSADDFDGEVNINGDVQLDDFIQTDLNQTALKQLLHRPVQTNQPGWLENNWLIGLLLAVLVLVALATAYSYQKTRPKAGIRPAVSPG